MAVVVGVFALAASLYQMHSERNYKKLILKTRLEGYADRIAMFGPQVSFNEEVRVTLLSREGTVLYDSEDPGLSSDHSGRPEFLQCREDCSGWAIRHSETEGRDYCYLTKMAGDRIIRVAIPYEVDLKHFLRSDTVYTIVGLLLLLLLLCFSSLQDSLKGMLWNRRCIGRQFTVFLKAYVSLFKQSIYYLLLGFSCERIVFCDIYPCNWFYLIEFFCRYFYRHVLFARFHLLLACNRINYRFSRHGIDNRFSNRLIHDDSHAVRTEYLPQFYPKVRHVFNKQLQIGHSIVVH